MEPLPEKGIVRKIAPENLRVTEERAEVAQEAINDYDTGSGATFGIQTNVNLRDGKMTVEEFVTLAAIRSCLGRNKVRMITREMIAARIAGYGSPKKVPENLKPSEIELQRLARVVERLHKRDRFRRHTWKKRHTYYTTTPKMNHRQLAEHVRQLKSTPCPPICESWSRRGER